MTETWATWAAQQAARKSCLKPERLGADPPMALTELYKLTSADIYNACGIPQSLTVESPGVSQREALRRFAYLSVEPCLKMVASECSMKLECRCHST